MLLRTVHFIPANIHLFSAVRVIIHTVSLFNSESYDFMPFFSLMLTLDLNYQSIVMIKQKDEMDEDKPLRL